MCGRSQNIARSAIARWRLCQSRFWLVVSGLALLPHQTRRRLALQVVVPPALRIYAVLVWFGRPRNYDHGAPLRTAHRGRRGTIVVAIAVGCARGSRYGTRRRVLLRSASCRSFGWRSTHGQYYPPSRMPKSRKRTRHTLRVPGSDDRELRIRKPRRERWQVVSRPEASATR